VSVFVAKPGFELLKYALITKRDNLLGHLKLFPEYGRVFKLLN